MSKRKMLVAAIAPVKADKSAGPAVAGDLFNNVDEASGPAPRPDRLTPRG